MLSDLIQLALAAPSQPDVISRENTTTPSDADDTLSFFISQLAPDNSHRDKLSRIRYRLQLLSEARQDPDKADALLATNLSVDNGALPLLDFTRWPQVYYAVSGELQTAESEAWFQNLSAAAATLRAAIADAERAKGTPAFNILEKILAFNSALPERYKAMANIMY
ncbi:hypothetical protein [Enterobacter sp. SA197]